MKINWFTYLIIIFLVLTNVLLIITIGFGINYIIENNNKLSENINMINEKSNAIDEKINTINENITTIYLIEVGNYIKDTKRMTCERVEIECKDMKILEINEKTLSTKEYSNGYKKGWCVDFEYKSYISVVDGTQAKYKWVTQSETLYVVLTSYMFKLEWGQVGVADNQLCMRRN
jgi:hypothetical protein